MENTDKYNIPYGIYHTDQNNDYYPLQKLDITVDIKNFSKHGLELLEKYEKFSQYIGKQMDVLKIKNGTVYGTIDGEDYNLDLDCYELTFKDKNGQSIEINNFLKKLREMDLTKEYRQLSETLSYGYVEHYASNVVNIYAGIKSWLTKNPESLLYMDMKRKNNQEYYFPNMNSDPELINEFKETMLQHVKENTPEMNVLNSYISDWEQYLDNKKKPKIKP